MAALRVFARGLLASSRDQRRRQSAAFLLGAAISAAGLTALTAERAGAHGPFILFRPPVTSGGIGFRLEPLGPAKDASVADRRKHGQERITIVSARAPAGFSGGPVCVRLCDGAFFPLAASGAGAEAAQCDSQCPDAPTEVFYRDGADRIEDAISASGKRYAELPVALRFQKVADATCTCHRAAAAYSPLRDPTLRRGDAIMTPAGFVVFHGAEDSPHRLSDFIALAQARLPQARRQVLAAMERASVADQHPTLAQWMAPRAAPTLAAAAPISFARGGPGDDRIRIISGRRAED